MEINKTLDEREFVIINVGANTSHHGLVSPLWENGDFCIMPIPEEGMVPNPSKDLFPSCRNLPSFADFVKPYIAFCVHEKYLTKTVHEDPEFETFTYGDNPDGIAKGKAANLKHLSNGDLLFFFAGLTAIRGRELIGDYRFYFIAFFELSSILPKVTAMPTQEQLSLFGRNAHIKRGQADTRFFNDFWVWKGSGNSQLFRKAVLFDRELGAKILVSRSGAPYSWPTDRTDLQLLGSRCRASRRLIGRQRKRVLLQRV